MEKFEGSHSCVVFRFSHALGDGFTIVQLLLNLTDEVADSGRPATVDKNVIAKSASDFGVSSMLRDMGSMLLNAPYAFYLLSGLPLLWEPHSLLRASRVGKKAAIRFAQPISIPDLKNAIRPMGATINDGIMGIIGGAARRYHEAQGSKVPRSFSTLLTFNVRGTAPTAKLEEDNIGNKTLGLIVPTSLDPCAKVRILSAKRCIDRLKRSPIMVFAGLLHKFGAVAAGLVMLRPLFTVWLRLRRLLGTSLPFPSLLLTNVPGPANKRTVLGTDLLAIQAFAGLPNTFCAFSYNGQLRISYTADQQLVDSDLIVQCLNEEVSAFLKLTS